MCATKDFAITSVRPEVALTHLVGRVHEIMFDVERSDVWDAVMTDDSPIELVSGVLREAHLEAALYQPDSQEAVGAAIAQFPPETPVAWLDKMFRHQVTQADRCEAALRDYGVLGGDIAEARRRRQSPSAFAVAAVWRNIAQKRDPYACLGALYLFDAVTPTLTARVKEQLARRLGRTRGLEFIAPHAAADAERERQNRRLILDVSKARPESVESIIYGFEYLAQVYPLPVWSAALIRAQRSIPLSLMAAE